MKIAGLGDTHLLYDRPIARKDDAHRVQMEKMRFVMDWAVENQAIVIQPGDLFDTARSWHLISAYSKFFLDYKGKVPIYSVFGQHDTYMYSEKTRHATGLGVLIANKLVRQLTDKRVIEGGFKKVDIYGASFGQPIPKVSYKDGFNILAVHKMIVDKKLWPGQEDYVYAKDFLEKYEDYDLIICGDCHRKYMFENDGRIIINSGPLFRKEADEYNLTKASPGFYVYDTEDEDLEWVDIPHEPAEKVLSRAHLDRQEEADDAMEKFVSSVKVNGDVKTVDFISNLMSFLEDNQVETGVKDILSELMDKEIK